MLNDRPARASDLHLALALPLDIGPDMLALPRHLTIDLGFDRIAGSENGAPNLMADLVRNG
jgi:hypothetical protein